jgi:hypothetical protein
MVPTGQFTPAPAMEDPAEVAPTPLAGMAVPQDMFEIPPALRVDAPMMPAFRLSHPNQPGPDLASVHGGSLHAASPQLAVPLAGDPPRANRWAVGVLSIAAVLGVIAAVALNVGPRESSPEGQPVRGSQEVTLPVTPAIVEPATPPPATEQQAAPRTPTVPEAVATQAAQAPTVPAPSVPAPTAPAPQDPAPKPDTTPAPAVAHDETASDDRDERPRLNAPAKKKKPGVLRLNAVGWAWVQIDGGPKREVVGAKFPLAPGRHTLRASNDTGAAISHSFTIVSDRVKSMKIDLELGSIREID